MSNKKKSKTTSVPSIRDEENVDIFFDEEDNLTEELNEELEEVIVDVDKTYIVEEFFDFEAFETSQEALVSEQ
ncbi:2015_t:CDS:1, partial [Cetraspora pellucida]